MRIKRFLVVALMMLVAGVVLAACGGSSSSSSSSSTSSESSAPEEAKPEESISEGSAGGESGSTMVPAPAETPPTTLPAGLTPLPKPPPKGLSIVTLQCDFPTCTGYTKIFESVAKKLGWKNKSIVFKTGQPQAAMTQAVNFPGVEYINISGVPTTIIEPQLKVAEEKGIKVMKGEDPTPAIPPTVPVAISTALGNAEIPARELTRWVINDSEGKAHLAVIGLPEIPITKPTPPTMKKTAEAECPECTVEEIPVTGEELAAGTVPAKVVAFLQSHPETNYVSGAFGNLMLGLPEARKTAGFSEKVKLVSQNGIEPAEAEALKKGELAAFFVNGQGSFGTAWADAIAREAEGLPLPQKTYEEIPQPGWLCTPETAEECAEWETLPPSILKQWEELWTGK